jgi:hypothetical protein
MLPGVSSAGLLDSALRFWSFDGTLSDSVANIGATSRGGWDGGYSTDRDGNLGGALDLTGDLDAVIVDSSSDLATLSQYSLSLWFRMDSHNGPLGRSQIFDVRDAGGTETASIRGLIDNTATGGVISNLDPVNAWLFPYTVSDGSKISLESANNQTWHHLLFSVSDTQEITYFNGNEVASSSPFSGNTPSNFNPGIAFGDRRGDLGGGFNFNGSLDDIALWDRALSASDAAALFAAPASASVPAPTTLLLLLSGIGLLRAGKRGQG